MDVAAVSKTLEEIGQPRLAKHVASQSGEAQNKLAAQLSALDLPHIATLVEQFVKIKAAAPLPSNIQPAKIYPRQADAEHRSLYHDAEQRGAELLRGGKVGAF